GGADDGDHFAGPDIEVDVVEDAGIAVVAEGDVAEGDGSLHLADGEGVGGVGDLRAGVEGLEDAVNGGSGPLKGDVEVYEAHGGVVEGGDPAVEGEQFSDLHLAAQDEGAAVPEDESGADGADDLGDGSESAVEAHLLHAEGEVVADGLHELLGLVVFADEGFDDGDAGEFLLEDAQHGVPAFAQLLAEGADVADEEFVVEDVEGDDGDGEEGQPPLHREQDEEESENAEEVGEEGDEAAGDHVLDGVNVAGEAGHDLAGLSGVVVGEGESVEMAVGLEAQVEDDALSEPSDEIVEGEGDEAAKGVQAQNHPEDKIERAPLLVRQDVVNRVAHDHRHQDRRKGDAQQQKHGQRHALPI